MISLKEILRGAPVNEAFPNDLKIRAVTTDSRTVQEGDLFIALPPLNGEKGVEYIQEAAKKGARVILKSHQILTDTLDSKEDLLLLNVENPRKAASKIASNLYPRQPKYSAAVTGTNGKTSTVHFLKQLWQLSGRSAASIGTLGLLSDKPLKNQPKEVLTSPDAFTLHRLLDEMAQEDITHVAMEASSHGLDQHRVDGVRLTAAAFTNLTHDHLDYHKTFENYFEAKKRLFTEVLSPGSTAVLNADDAHFKALQEVCRRQGHQVFSYGQEGEEIQLANVELKEDGQILDIYLFGRPHRVFIPLIGLFQSYNVLCALGLALATHEKEEELLSHLDQLKSVPGRLEYVGKTKQGAPVYVDYAHTPQALESLLKAIRPHVKDLLSIVFGCGGDRDPFKRPLMGKIASVYADRLYVADDNPRSEDPEKIRQQILEGCPEAHNIGDRRKAIHKALKDLSDGQALVIAGKGHEPYQIFHSRTEAFDDRLVAKECLRDLRGDPA